jgi:hypothetical protein
MYLARIKNCLYYMEIFILEQFTVTSFCCILFSSVSIGVYFIFVIMFLVIWIPGNIENICCNLATSCHKIYKMCSYTVLDSTEFTLFMHYLHRVYRMRLQREVALIHILYFQKYRTDFHKLRITRFLDTIVRTLQNLDFHKVLHYGSKIS